MKNKFILVIIAISLLLGTSTLRRGHEWGDDWAWYVLQAKSVAEGTTREFVDISSFTNYQSTTHLGPLAYPWGYPLILTPFYMLNGISPLTLKIPALIFYAGFLFLLYLFAKPHFALTESWLLVSLFAFNPLFINFLDQILSDIPFLFFATLTLCLVTKEGRDNWQHYVLIGISVFCTAFLRVTGALLLGCFLAVEFFRLIAHRKVYEIVKRIIMNSLIVCAVFAALWFANILMLPRGGESYLSQYKNLTPDMVKGYVVAYFQVFSWFFGEGRLWQYVYYFVLTFALLGAWIRRKHERFFLWFFASWMLVHVTYPYWQGARYIFPLLPIFIYFALQGMKFVISKLPETNQLLGQRVLYGFWLAIITYFLFSSSSTAIYNIQNGRKINGPFDPQSMEVYDWISRKTSADSVLIFYKARAMRLMTNHPTIMINVCDGMLKGDYLILSKKVGRNNQVPPEEIDSCNLPIDKRFENRRFIIYEIQK